MDASSKIQRSIHDVRLTYKYVSRILGTYHVFTRRSFFCCIGNKNKPPAMQVCSQTALASSKKPPCYNEYKVRQPNHYNKEESKWTIIVYHTQNGHANII